MSLFSIPEREKRKGGGEGMGEGRGRARFGAREILVASDKGLFKSRNTN